MAINLELKLRPGESVDKLIKRFFKKCKNQEIVREYLNRVSYFKSKRQKRREKSAKAKFIKRKEKE